MKPIKFPLTINGVQVRSLESLRDNFTAEILTLYKRGLLVRWLQSFNYETEAKLVSATIAPDSDFDLLIALGSAIGIEINVEVAHYMLENEFGAAKFAPSDSPHVDPAAAMSDEECRSDQEHSDQSIQDEFDRLEEAAQIEFLQLRELSLHLQEKFAREGTPAIRGALAKNQCLAEEWQLHLFKTGSDEIKRALGENKNISEAIQKLLLDSSDWSIRAALAANPSLKQQFHDTLDADDDIDVRCAFAKNPSLSVQQQEKIYACADPNKMPNKYTIDREIAANKLRASLSTNQSLCAALLHRLADDSCSDVQAALATNPLIREELQARFISLGYENISRGVATNSSLSIALQNELLSKGSVEARVALFYNPSLNERVKKSLLESLSRNNLVSLETKKDELEKSYHKASEEQLSAENESCQYYSVNPGFFYSKEKEVKLARHADCCRRRTRERYDEYMEACSYYSKLSTIIKLQA